MHTVYTCTPSASPVRHSSSEHGSSSHFLQSQGFAADPGFEAFIHQGNETIGLVMGT
jgi:hypothetical protein